MDKRANAQLISLEDLKKVIEEVIKDREKKKNKNKKEKKRNPQFQNYVCKL